MSDKDKDNEGVDKTTPIVITNFTETGMPKENNSFGKWFERNALDIVVYSATALLIGGAVWLAYAAVKEEIAEQEALAEAAKKQIKLVTDAYSRGAMVLAGPATSTWIIEGDKVELIY